MARTQAADYEQRRGMIVELAAELFARVGFAGASIAELAAACNTSKSLMYHYFPSKEDILHEVMASHLDQLVEDVGDVVAAGGEPYVQLGELLHRFMRHYVGAAARQKVLLDELGNLPSERRRVIVSKQRRIVDAVQQLLAALHPELAADPARARVHTMLLFGMINWTSNWFDPEGAVSADEIAERVRAMIAAPLAVIAAPISPGASPVARSPLKLRSA